MKNIIISTGGSGGHVIPALVLYDHLKEKNNVLLISDLRGIKYIEKNKYKYQILNVRNSSSNILLFPFFIINFMFLTFKSFLILRKNKIDILISTGGYMSLPLNIASIIYRTKLLLFEPNSVIGRSNKYSLRFAKKIICYNDKIKNFPKNQESKIYIINSLLRQKFYEVKYFPRKIDNEIFVAILGGSQGAKFFDNLSLKFVVSLSKIKKIRVLQQIYNKSDQAKFEKIYEQNNIQHEIFSFDSDIINKLSKVDIAFTRCGASTLSELVQLKIPFVGIPYPFAKDNHQYFNAKYYENEDCCWIFEQKNISVGKMIDLVKSIMSNSEIYNQKIQKMANISYQNGWNNINKKLTELINEY